MQPSSYGPYPYLPISQRKRFRWPDDKRLALWVIPNLEFFHLKDVMPGNHNERIPAANAKTPNVRNWALRDYGNRVGFWRMADMLARHGIRGTAALNSDICVHHPQMMERAVGLGWEFMGHGKTNAQRLNEMDPAGEREAIKDVLDTIAKSSGKRPVGWLGAGLQETWSTLDILADEGVKYIADWVSDDLPYRMKLEKHSIHSIPYSLMTNDTPHFFEQKTPGEQFETVIRRQFDWLYREAEDIPRVMAIALHPFVTGQPYRMAAVDEALAYICRHPGVWKATGSEIIEHYAKVSDE